MTNTERDLQLHFRRWFIIAGILFICVFIVRAPKAAPPQLAPAQGATGLLDPNPLPPFPSLELENLTWMEVRDRIKAGTTRILVPTGGIEQNGPFVSVSKHNHIARAVSVRVAELLGLTMTAPVIPFVPEGAIKPPSGHMQFAGTISVTEQTFEGLLQDVGASLAVHGFTEIVFLGDSGDNQQGLQNAVALLNRRFDSTSARAIYVPEFYNYPEVRAFLATKGIDERPETFHEELAFSLQLLAIEPSALRYDQRIAAGFTTLGGLSLLEREKLTTLGREILEMRAQATVKAIRERERSLNRK